MCNCFARLSIYRIQNHTFYAVKMASTSRRQRRRHIKLHKQTTKATYDNNNNVGLYYGVYGDLAPLFNTWPIMPGLHHLARTLNPWTVAMGCHKKQTHLDEQNDASILFSSPSCFTRTPLAKSSCKNVKMRSKKMSAGTLIGRDGGIISKVMLSPTIKRFALHRYQLKTQSIEKVRTGFHC